MPRIQAVRIKSLPREEWDFRSISDDELEACFLAEYFRELPDFREKKAFQLLTRAEKKRMIRDDMWSRGHGSSYLAIRNPGHVLYERIGRWNYLILRDETFVHELGHLMIDWDKSDKEVARDFLEWIKQFRPPGTSADKRGIKLNSLRVNLDRLGVMRLLHHHSPTEIRDTMPDAWKFLSQREYFKERKRAAAVFGDLFPAEKKEGVSAASFLTKTSRAKKVGSKSR